MTEIEPQKPQIVVPTVLIVLCHNVFAHSFRLQRLSQVEVSHHVQKTVRREVGGTAFLMLPPIIYALAQAHFTAVQIIPRWWQL
jgi:hypothetical protein